MLWHADAMVFDFYYRLSAPRRREYERSDALGAPSLDTAIMRPLGESLQGALASGDQTSVRLAAQAVADAFGAQLQLPPTRVSVLRTRPQRGGSEYHGYYEGGEDGKKARITLWMFTARRRQVVAYRTFLRTLVHELCHHLDFEGFKMDESFHTEGFYKRESALFRSITGEPPGKSGGKIAVA